MTVPIAPGIGPGFQNHSVPPNARCDRNRRRRPRSHKLDGGHRLAIGKTLLEERRDVKRRPKGGGVMRKHFDPIVNGRE